MGTKSWPEPQPATSSTDAIITDDLTRWCNIRCLEEGEKKIAAFGVWTFRRRKTWAGKCSPSFTFKSMRILQKKKKPCNVKNEESVICGKHGKLAQPIVTSPKIGFSPQILLPKSDKNIQKAIQQAPSEALANFNPYIFTLYPLGQSMDLVSTAPQGDRTSPSPGASLTKAPSRFVLEKGGLVWASQQ